jgi:VanZ family protein
MIEDAQDIPHSTTRRSAAGTSRLSRYGPLVAWTILIFIGSGDVLSAQHTSLLLLFVKWLFPSASPHFLSTVHFLIRKAGHLTEYAILATLGARAFHNSTHESLRRNWFWLALLLAIAYALSDEFHQSFVPARTASIYDCMIDTAGALLALGVFWLRHRRGTEPSVRIPTSRDNDRIEVQSAAL